MTGWTGAAGGRRALAFRDADEGDIAEVDRLIQSAYRGDDSRAGWTTEADLLDGRRTDPAELAATLERPHSRIILAVGAVGAGGAGEEGAGAIVGCCRVERHPDATARLGLLAVRPSLQSAGIGRSLVAEAERRVAGDWGVDRMEMTVLRPRRELIAWYGRLGYRPTGRSEPFPYGDERFGLPKRPGLDFVVLAKQLTTQPAQGR